MNSIRECILEVDDDANDIYFLRHAFKEARITNPVRVVGDGEKAIAYLTGTGPYADRIAYPLPGLVVLDLMLPRKSGLEVLQWLQGQPLFENLVVVVFSASSDPRDIERSYAFGAKAFVVKPVDLHQCVEFAKRLKACWLDGQKGTPDAESNAVAATHTPAGCPDPLPPSLPSRMPTPVALAMASRAWAQSRSPWQLP